MTWPFENDTSAITKKLAKESLKSEKRRNFMIIIAISLDRKSTRLNSSHWNKSRMPSSA